MTADVYDVDPVVVVYLQHASPLDVHILDMSDLQQSSAFIYVCDTTNFGVVQQCCSAYRHTQMIGMFILLVKGVESRHQYWHCLLCVGNTQSHQLTWGRHEGT
jgi:hypothetical protein